MNNAFQISTTYRLDQLEKKTRSLEESLALLGQKQLNLEKVSDQLVRQRETDIETIREPILNLFGTLEAFSSKSRKKDAVRERWEVWEKLDRIGVKPCEIARAFNYDHGSVLFAKSKGFKSGWTTKAERRGLEA